MKKKSKIQTILKTQKIPKVQKMNKMNQIQTSKIPVILKVNTIQKENLHVSILIDQIQIVRIIVEGILLKEEASDKEASGLVKDYHQFSKKLGQKFMIKGWIRSSNDLNSNCLTILSILTHQLHRAFSIQTIKLH